MPDTTAPAAPKSAPQPKRRTPKVQRFKEVCLRECTEAFFLEGAFPKPNLNAVQALKTREVERIVGEEKVNETRQAWIYVFRLEVNEELPDDDDNKRTAFVQEWYANTEGKYQRATVGEKVEQGGAKKKNLGDPKPYILVVAEGPYDPSPSYFFRLSSERLPPQRVKEIREKLNRTGMSTTMPELKLNGVRDYPHARRMKGGGHEVFLVDYFLLAETLAATFQKNLYRYNEWTGRLAPVKHLASVTYQLTGRQQHLKDLLRTADNGLNARLAWKVTYTRKRRALYLEWETALIKLLFCLRSKSFQGRQLDYAACVGEHHQEKRIRGSVRYGRITRDLDLTTQGQAYLKEIYDNSQLAKALASFQYDPSALPKERRTQIEQALAQVDWALDASEKYADRAVVHNFNALNEAFGLASKGLNGVFGVLENFATTVTRRHRVASREALAVVFSVTTARVVQAGRLPSVRLTESGGVQIESDYVVARTLRSTQLDRYMYLRGEVFELEETPQNLPARLTESGGYVAFRGALAAINLAMSAADLADLKERASGGASTKEVLALTGAVSEMGAFVAERVKVAAGAWEGRISLRLGGAGKATIRTQLSTGRVVARSGRVAGYAVAALTAAGLAVDVVLGGYAIGKQVGEGDYDAAFAWTVVTAGGMALNLAGFEAIAGGSLIILGVEIGMGVLLSVVGALFVATGFVLVYFLDEGPLEPWVSEECLWGEAYLEEKWIGEKTPPAAPRKKLASEAVALAKGGPGATPSKALLSEIGRQLGRLYETLYDFEARLTWENIYGDEGGVFSGDPDPEVAGLLVRVKRTMRFPLPTKASFVFDFKGGSGAVPDQHVKLQDELLARFSEADAGEPGLSQAPTEPQKLLDGEEPPDSSEGDGSGDFDPRVAKLLVLRLFEPDKRALRLLKQKEGHYCSFPVGAAVPRLKRVMQTATAQPKEVEVRLLLGDEEEGVPAPSGGGLTRNAELETWR